MKFLYRLFLTGLITLSVNTAGFGQTGAQSFAYDAAGNRVSRTILIRGQGGGGESKGATTEKNVKEIIDNAFDQEIPMRIYPNPTKGIVRIDLGSTMSEDISGVRIVAYDLGGRKLIDKKAEGVSSSIDFSGYPDGTYILHVIFGEVISPWKIIKQ